MSNVSSVSYTPPPAPDYVSPVVEKIQSQIGKISDLYQDISAIMREISALKAPEKPTRGKKESAEDFAGRMKKYGEDLTKFQADLNQLNSRLRSVQDRLARALLVLQRLQNSDLPTAERKQAQEIEKNFKDAQKAIENAVQGAEELSGAAEETGSSQDERVEIKALEKKVEVKAEFDDMTLSELVSMFSLGMTAIQASPEKVENPFTKVPAAGGTGLPPVSTP